MSETKVVVDYTLTKEEIVALRKTASYMYNSMGTEFFAVMGWSIDDKTTEDSKNGGESAKTIMARLFPDGIEHDSNNPVKLSRMTGEEKDLCIALLNNLTSGEECWGPKADKFVEEIGMTRDQAFGLMKQIEMAQGDDSLDDTADGAGYGYFQRIK